MDLSYGSSYQKNRGLWNLFLADDEMGTSLTTLEYPPTCT